MCSLDVCRGFNFQVTKIISYDVKFIVCGLRLNDNLSEVAKSATSDVAMTSLMVVLAFCMIRSRDISLRLHNFGIKIYSDLLFV